jgi:hypothetical protein
VRKSDTRRFARTDTRVGQSYHVQPRGENVDDSEDVEVKTPPSQFGSAGQVDIVPEGRLVATLQRALHFDRLILANARHTTGDKI